MLFQPLEQFKPTVIFFFQNELYLSFVEFLFFNKYVCFIFLLFLILIFTLYVFFNQKNLISFVFFQFLYNRIVLEMLNIVSFNFIFFVILYFSVFIYIYIFNLIGLFPNTACWTTQIYGNLMLSFTLIFGITLSNLDKNGVLFFELSIPKNVPKILIPFLFLLEFLSYFIRILSLSIRLFSNMVAGHSLLHILYDMILNIKYFLEAKLDLFFSIYIIVISLLFVILVSEFIVAFLQAYVFAVMSTIYLNDLNLQH